MHAGRSFVSHVDAPLFVEPAEPGKVFGRGPRVEEATSTAATLPGRGDPAVHGDVVGVKGDPVAEEGQDGVRLDVVEELTDQRRAAAGVTVELAVWQSQEPVVIDSEHRH